MGNSMMDIRRRIAMNQPHIVTPTSAGIVTFNTDMKAPLKELKINVEPKQDLHGYDHPWPAGGGKNLANTTEWLRGVAYNPDIGATISFNVVTDVTDNGDGTFSFNNSVWVSRAIRAKVQGETAYVLSGTFVGNNSFVGWFITDENNVVLKKVATYDVTTFFAPKITTPSGAAWIYMQFGDRETGTVTKNVITKPQCELGSTVTAYAPYKNECPISGWTGANVWDDPKHGGLIEWNQLLKEINGENWAIANANGTFSNSVCTFTATASSGYCGFSITPRTTIGHKYLYSCDVKSTNGAKLRLRLNGGYDNALFTATGEWENINGVFTAEFSSQNYSVWDNRNSDWTEIQFKNYMLFDLTAMFGAGNEPTTVDEFKALFPADYYPYNAGEITTVSAVNGDPYRHYSITLPTEAGTVYGGELTVNADGSGSLVVDRANVDLGTLNWVIQTNYSVNRFGALVNGMTKATSTPYYKNIMCSAYKPSNVPITTVNENGTIGRYNGWIYICDAQFSDVESFKAAMSGVQLIYELAEPITYTLTASEIRTLLGTNNVWANAGNVELSYWTHTP